MAIARHCRQDGELSVLLKGNRIEITADVVLAGTERLKEMG